MYSSKWTKKLEIAGVIATAAGKFIFMDFLDLKLPYIILVIIGWSVYVGYKTKLQPGILAHWGFRTDNFGAVIRMLVPFAIISVSAFIVIGIWRDTLNVTWHIVPVLLLYPIWGTIQQFLLIALVAGNWQDLRGAKARFETIIIFVTALLFAAIHYPHYWLMFGTFVLAIIYGFTYLRSRNLFVLGIFHGWLGAIFFYTVVGRDPFAEVFGKLIPLQ